MGLLDNDQLMLGLSLMAAGAAKPIRTGFGEGLLGALSNVQGMQDRRAEMAAREEDRKQRAAMQAMQAQQIQMQLADRQRQQQQEQDQRNYLGAMDSSAGPAIEPTLPALLAKGFSPQIAGALMTQKKDPSSMLGQISPKDYEPASFAEFMRTGNPAALRAVPKDQTPDEFERALKLAGIDPASPQGRKLATARLQKMATHQPGVSVSYGAPMAGIGPDGKPVFFLPPKDPKTPPAIIPGVTPPKKAPPVEFTKSVSGLNELENGLSSYEKTLKENNGIGPLSSGATRANLQGSYTSLQMGLKNAFELGALAGPDLELLQGMLVDPTSPKAVLLGDKGVAAQINKAREYLKNRRKAVYRAHDEPLPADAATPNVIDFGDLK